MSVLTFLYISFLINTLLQLNSDHTFLPPDKSCVWLIHWHNILTNTENTDDKFSLFHFQFLASAKQHSSYYSVVHFTVEIVEDHSRFKEFCLFTMPAADSSLSLISRFL